MTVFAHKLGGLSATIDLALQGPLSELAAALREGRGRNAVVVGSGGSTVAAEYLARCRSTLGLGPTVVRTPMEFLLGDESAGEETWLVSAGADNPDVAAAFHGALRGGQGPIRLLTVRADGATAKSVENAPSGSVFVLPVADPKDGFLATHSLIAMIAGLLAASDLLTEVPGNKLLMEWFGKACRATLGTAGMSVSTFEPGDTIVLLHDPQVRAVATLIETFAWESGVAAVQKVDFRNFAHGRHVWAARHAGSMFVLALTAADSRSIWEPISSLLPPSVRQASLDLGNAGRFQIGVGIAAGLSIVKALGDRAGIDPGRPGKGEFGRPIYESEALLALAKGLTSHVRHKRRAQLAIDARKEGAVSLCGIGRSRIDDLAQARFAGLVLDYDGTVVETAARADPPDASIVAQLARLIDAGVRLGFATGRGGSAGEALRQALPERVHRSVIVGYYNGGHLRTLDVDIRTDPPEPDKEVADFVEWLLESGLLQPGAACRRAPGQLTIEHGHIRDASTFAGAIGLCPHVSGGRVRVLSSHHSFDVIPANVSKTRVVDALRNHPNELVLCLGDSGSLLGNDRELLSEPHGLSVDSVCGDEMGSWSLFGDELTGPRALLRILSAMQTEEGRFVVDTRALGLDE